MTQSHASGTRERQLSVDVDDDLHDTIAKRAAKNDISKSTYAALVLEQHIQYPFDAHTAGGND